MLQEVAQHPGSGWLWLLQLFFSGRPLFLLPIEASGSSSCLWRDRSPTRHVPSHWDSLVDLLQYFNYSGNLPLLLNCLLSVKSHNKGHKLGFGVLFHLHWPPATDFGVFLPFLIFSFHIAFAQRPPKIKFLILWAAANGVHRKLTREIWYFFRYFLSSSEYRAEKQTRRKALAAHCLSLTPMVSSRWYM